MSVDVLFTEAAEAGGPPRFTEDDIEHRVGGRRRRRRGLAGAAAVVVVLAGGALGVRLATQDPADEVVAGPSNAEASIVPFDDGALVGDWTALDPMDRIDGEVTIAFDADGGYVQTGCNGATGQWLVTRGHLTIGTGIVTSMACPGTGLQAADTAFGAASRPSTRTACSGSPPPASRSTSSRDDDPTPPDPEAVRAPAPTPVPTDAATVAGRWVVADIEADGSPARGSLALADDGTLDWDGCGSGTGQWAIDDGKVVLRNVVDLSGVLCAYEPGHPFLDQVLDGRAIYTDDDQLLLIDDVGTIALRRAEPATGPLTGVRWVATGPLVEPYTLVPWIELSDDGTYTAQAVCGQSSGDWTRTDDELTFRFTGRDLPACPENLIVEAGDRGHHHRPPRGRRAHRRLLARRRLPPAGRPRLCAHGRRARRALAGRTRRLPGRDRRDVAVPTVRRRRAGDGDELPHDPGSSSRYEGSTRAAHRRRSAVPHRAGSRGDGHPARFGVRSHGQRRRALLADAFAAMGVEACCGEPSHGSPVATSGFVHEGVNVPVTAGPGGSIYGYVRFAGIEAVLDQRASLSQADGLVIVGFECGDLVVALSPVDVLYPVDTPVLLAAAERLIDAVPCEARPTGLP